MAGDKKLPATAAAVAQSYAAPTTRSPANVTGDPTQNLQTFKLEDLAPFTKEGVFSTNASSDVHLFYVGRDDVHDILKYILSRVTVSLYLNMFGFDDAELNNILMEKALDPAVTMLVTLDSSQADGVHEKALLEADEKYNLASASLLVARIAVSARRRFVSPPSSRCRAEPACTVIVAMLWATVSCISRGRSAAAPAATRAAASASRSSSASRESRWPSPRPARACCGPPPRA